MPFVRKGKAPQKQPAGGKRKNGRKRNFLCAAGCPTGRRAFKKSPPVLGWAAAKKNNQKLWLTPVAGSAASRLPPSASPAVTASASCRRPSSPLRSSLALMTMRVAITRLCAHFAQSKARGRARAPVPTARPTAPAAERSDAKCAGPGSDRTRTQSNDCGAVRAQCGTAHFAREYR